MTTVGLCFRGDGTYRPPWVPDPVTGGTETILLPPPGGG